MGLSVYTSASTCVSHYSPVACLGPPLAALQHFYYRAMHYSAKRGLAIACRLSVRLSVTLVDQDHRG